MRVARGASALPSRRANCGSAVRPRAAGSAFREASEPSASSREKRQGCSDWAERRRPQSGCLDGVGGFVLGDRHRALGDQGEAAGRQVRVGDPLLEQRQRLLGGGERGLAQIPLRALGGEEHHRRSLGPGLDRGAQLGR